MSWIEDFVSITEEIGSPESFRLWTAITIVAGVLERKVWTTNRKGTLYPNQFTILCGLPSTGKSLMISQAKKFWTNVPEIHIGPDDPTRKSFLEALESSTRTYINGAGATIFSALSLPATELGVLFSSGDKDFFSTMAKLYDNEDHFSAPRSVSKSVMIERPTVNILGGATPDFIGDMFPDIAWGQGFTRRLMFIYGTDSNDLDIDIFKLTNKTNYDQLQKDLNLIATINGEFSWEPLAMSEVNNWLKQRLPPVPTHPRLTHYCGSRVAHLFKLCMIAAISRSKALTVTVEDFVTAKKWLLDAEATMPDVFRAMKQRSDDVLIKEAHQFVYAKYSSVVRENRVPLPESILWEFFQERTTSEKVQYVIRSMYQSDMIRQSKPGFFIPQPKSGV